MHSAMNSSHPSLHNFLLLLFMCSFFKIIFNYSEFTTLFTIQNGKGKLKSTSVVLWTAHYQEENTLHLPKLPAYSYYNIFKLTATSLQLQYLTPYYNLTASLLCPVLHYLPQEYNCCITLLSPSME